METSKIVSSESSIQSSTFRLIDHSKVAPGLFGLVFDLPNEKVNKLSPPVMRELSSVLDSLANRKDIKTLVFFTGKESIFIAGADIEVIKGITNVQDARKMAAEGQAVIQKIENLPFPTIAAVHGACMGGGTEFALCCTYIVTSDSPSTRIALPEVNLGILPGFGGTVRLPERIGIQASLDYVLTGKAVNGEKAVKAGISDACFPFQTFESNVLKFATKVLKGEVKPKRFNPSLQASLLEGNPIGRAVLFSQARKMVMSKSKGHYPAPLKILDVLADNAGKSKEQALKRENEAFGELAVTSVSKRLIDLFYATEKIKKQTGAKNYKLTAKDKVTHFGLLGAGVMGGGIAQLVAQKGIPVRMKDVDFKGLGLGMAAAQKLFSGLVKKRKMTKREADIKLALISPTTEYTGLGSVDVVVEAVVENMDIKKKVLKETEAVMKADALFATNTSSLSVTELASVSSRPENVVGMHFFNPVHKMPLVEVIRGEKTSDRACAVIFDLSKKLGKTPIVVRDGAGFLVNRLLMPYLNEASYLMSEGCDILELDKAVLKFGMPMGPATLLDEVGLDVATKVAKILFHAFGERATPCPLNDKLVGAKLLGKKAQKGFFLYDSQGKKGELNPEIYSILGVKVVSKSESERKLWIPRMIYPIINEAALCLSEGIVETPEDVDLGMIMGTGFPPFTGGPLRYADSVGLKKIVADLEALSKSVSPRYTPVKPLVELANAGKGFYS